MYKIPLYGYYRLLEAAANLYTHGGEKSRHPYDMGQNALLETDFYNTEQMQDSDKFFDANVLDVHETRANTIDETN